ncbi:MAG: PepSY domain-containing protein [Gemmatimonadota bacterium]|nr:PepSY domain-containing protein [Gemmatimonadota bacterium]
MKKTRNPQARTALIAALGLLIGGSLGGVALARAQSTVKTHAEAEQKAPYKSSIQVPNDEKGETAEANEADEKGEAAEGKDANEADEQNEATSPEEHSEAAGFQKLARISSEQARSAALAAVPGTATGVELENEDGNLVYGVTVKTSAGERDVKVDAGNGKVLHIEKDEQD